MKIVVPGIKDTENEMRVTCSKCDTIFDISAEDIEKEEGIRRYYTKCPNTRCEGIIQLYEGKIPRSILWKVDLRETK